MRLVFEIYALIIINQEAKGWLSQAIHPGLVHSHYFQIILCQFHSMEPDLSRITFPFAYFTH